MNLTSLKEFMNEHYVEKINEVSKEEQLYKKLISTLKKDDTTYKIDDSKTTGQPRVIIGDYVIGSGTVYHDEYTIYKNKKELESYNSITKVLDYISNINEATKNKLYFVEDEFWVAYGQGSGSTTYMPKGLKSINNKKSDSGYDSNIDKVIEYTNEVKPLKTNSSKSMSLYEIPVYPNVKYSTYADKDTMYDIWGGNIKPTKKYYMTINKNGVIVAEFFKTKGEALGWLNSII